ncbi:MAG: hypothetical protein HY209_06410 [Candidatus Omnitrophica bacterium]|nr:hypothetical protein [Candidatus Omnitrophota bacterium]
MDIQEAFEKALKETEIIRSRVLSLQTFADTHVPYILLSASSINMGDTVVRSGEVLVQKPSLILPPNIPQLEGFEMEDQPVLDTDAMINFLLVRGVSLPSMKYNNKTSSLDIFEGRLDEAIKHYNNQLQAHENTTTGLLIGPQEVWPFSLMIFICSQIAKNSSADIRKLLDQWHRKNN